MNVSQEKIYARLRYFQDGLTGRLWRMLIKRRGKEDQDQDQETGDATGDLSSGQSLLRYFKGSHA